MSLGREFFKSFGSRATVIRINIALLIFFLAAYISILFLQPTLLAGKNAAAFIRCTLGDCNLRKVRWQDDQNYTTSKDKTRAFLEGLRGGGVNIGLVNIGEEEVVDLGIGGKTTRVKFDQVSDNLEWKDLFPDMIDEEDPNESQWCPEIPVPDFSAYEEMDAVVAKLPCRWPADGWSRDLFRLQIHLVAAKLASKKGRRDRRGAVKVVLLSKCAPMRELFRCDDLATRNGEWWMYEAEVERLEERLRLPVGSCKLALPFWQEGTDEEFDVSNLVAPPTRRRRREAYATVLHSSDAYLCGALVLAHSIRRTGSTRDLVLLHDKSIRRSQLAVLAAAGWALREVKRIRNPRAKKNAYNEYNYSKLRLWQLTDYDKVIFVDADIVVLRNLDHLFRFPQLSAAGDYRTVFNSGLLVIEPSSCAFNAMMAARRQVVSYNGGDQGFLNEMFVWWHRLPKRVNYLKYFKENTTAERRAMEELFEAEPAKIYAMHSLGLKPWRCYRDYDCNWNVGNQRVFASDVAHRRWWRLHDEMEEGLRGFCRLSEERKKKLERERKEAEEMEFSDGHWRLNITDERKNI
ncbi:UDP-glucuronate:xylan alpha-glucuronosyltransferase 2-like [Typha latifolia]|uniref:UDP-glucuronate:xylan alpha-glucuronosyltransferase 2-like n=1 Tax=Typha latifolia TaxID=4733 RepID=UPI003C2EDCE8